MELACVTSSDVSQHVIPALEARVTEETLLSRFLATFKAEMPHHVVSHGIASATVWAAMSLFLLRC